MSLLSLSDDEAVVNSFPIKTPPNHLAAKSKMACAQMAILICRCTAARVWALATMADLVVVVLVVVGLLMVGVHMIMMMKMIMPRGVCRLLRVQKGRWMCKPRAEYKM